MDVIYFETNYRNGLIYIFMCNLTHMKVKNNKILFNLGGPLLF